MRTVETSIYDQRDEDEAEEVMSRAKALIGTLPGVLRGRRFVAVSVASGGPVRFGGGSSPEEAFEDATDGFTNRRLGYSKTTTYAELDSAEKRLRDTLEDAEDGFYPPGEDEDGGSA